MSGIRRSARELYRDRGTRFMLYPQVPIGGSVKPEVVWLSEPPGTIWPGPSDSGTYVVDPIDKTPYLDPRQTPPYTGPCFPPVQPDAEGHFDYLEPGTREFGVAHMYGSMRFVLDVWSNYFTRP